MQRQLRMKWRSVKKHFTITDHGSFTFDFMNISLKAKNAVICGSSQGIGLAVAKELAQLGASCILLARAEDALKKAVASLPKDAFQQHSYRVIDFKDVEKTKAVVSEIVAQYTIHILINNSGGPAAGPIIEAAEDQFLQAFQQHLIINHLFTKAVIAGMKSEGYGRIVDIISTSVKIPLKNLGVSNTIRGAVASWAKTMSNELAQYGITVNNILPGMTKTSRLESLIKNTAESSNLTFDVVEKKMLAEIPAGRFGEAEEIAAVAAFLCTPVAGYVNGTSIRVDGGRTGSI